jgi:hypothetical protein
MVPTAMGIAGTTAVSRTLLQFQADGKLEASATLAFLTDHENRQPRWCDH